MVKFLEVLRIVTALLPIIRELVQTLEGMEGDGATKLKTVLEALRTAYMSTMSAGIDWEVIEPLVRGAIENILTLIRKK